MTAGNSKITRLPKQDRHDLNDRLEDGEPGRQLASLLHDLNLDLAPGTQTNGNQTPPQSTAPIQPNQTGSNQIKPNQTPPSARAASSSSPNRE